MYIEHLFLPLFGCHRINASVVKTSTQTALALKRNLCCPSSLVEQVRKLSTRAESCHQQCSTPQMFLPNMELKSWLARLEDFLRLRGIPPSE
ncbi:UDP-N-acetylglucosamine--N-acetylmuramyl-(pentapeptide) pyrophosphoryl-undecaprenol N-acetylglucosamine transferase [Trichinella pseudospiralis]